MTHPARSIDVGTIHHLAADVIASPPGRLRVRSHGGTLDARRAASCLLAPREGDVVEVSLVEGGDCWVTAVLERAGSATQIAVDGDLEIRAGGRASFSSAERLDLVAEDTVAVTAGRVEVRSVEVQATFERLTALGKLVHQQIEKVRTVSSTVDLVAERLTQTVERAYRFVGESETVRAGRIDVEATDTLRMHSKNAVVTADTLVKLDGGQIHMG